MAEVPSVRLRRDGKIDLLAGDSGTAHVRDVRRNPVEPESLRKRREPLRAQPEVDQRAQDHVPGDATEGIEDGYRHSQKSYQSAGGLCQPWSGRAHGILTEEAQRYDAPLPVL